MRIILDAMGGDNAPQAAVLGALDAARDFGTEITLVGRGEEILDIMRKNGCPDLPQGMEIARIPPWLLALKCWPTARVIPFCPPEVPAPF